MKEKLIEIKKEITSNQGKVASAQRELEDITIKWSDL